MPPPIHCSNLPVLIHNLKYRVVRERLSVSRLASDACIPAWALEGGFFCVVRTLDELSIVCSEDRVPDVALAERGWVALKLEGPFPFPMTGVLASFLQPLAEAQISVFAISTFDTDYVLIKRENLKEAVMALGAAGHEKLDEDDCG
ncbi:MAG TPA: ACT domain-containing protein [Terriglobales bacterium]